MKTTEKEILLPSLFGFRYEGCNFTMETKMANIKQPKSFVKPVMFKIIEF